MLVIDDDPLIRDTMSEVLEESGYQVTTAVHGREALDLLRQGHKADAIILDLMMPVMDGWQFLDEKARDDALSAVPVLIHTAYTAYHDGQNRSGDVLGVFRKPGDFARMIAVLSENFPATAT
ncbi:MAG TPA: response regulator [Myxococcales bacterium]|nr:response regulator [Myxococcales bacterium]